MSRYILRNGVEVDVLCFDIFTNQKNNLASMYYGIAQKQCGLERLLEWGPAGNCLYSSKYFYVADNALKRWVWNNKGPMEIDKFVKLEEYDITNLFGIKEELLQAKVKFINPILSLELE
jgi:hypothetical protein